MRTALNRRRLVVGITAAAALAAGGMAAGAHATADGPPERTDPRVKTRNPFPLPQLTGLRYSNNGPDLPGRGYDRIVFDLVGKAGGYDVRYVNSLDECASGRKVTVAGTKFLSVTLKPSQAHNSKGRNTYFGPGRTDPAKLNLGTVKGLAMTCDFEGHVGFGLGLDHKAGFNVVTLSNPTRIYIDIAH